MKKIIYQSSKFGEIIGGPQEPTSVIHKNIGEHEHDVTIFDSCEIYAACRLCGMHDWSLPNTDPSAAEILNYFKQKYPKHTYENL
jgi:hypothetical protein